MIAKPPFKLTFLISVLMGACMAFLMSAILTLLTTGYDSGYFARWMDAFGLSIVVAVPLAVIVAPFVERLALWILVKMKAL